MTIENKIYITASELAEMLGVSVGHAYKIIRKLNQELEKNGFLVIAGKVPRRYFEKRWYGFSAQEVSADESRKRPENREVADTVPIY